ncbi:MAG: hypothetical protein E7600_05875 [Ruminococcaceae bacterium]|nr:hypothetical protein [Oscillospiraceae bacterium]
MDNRIKNDEANIRNESLDSADAENKRNFAQTVSKFFKNFIKKIRFSFASACEESAVVKIIDNLYNVFLHCNTRFLAVFLTAFSVSSLLVNYLLVFNGIDFLFNTETIIALALLLIGIILFTTKKTIGELLSSGKILSQLTIVYSQHAIISFDNIEKKPTIHTSAIFSGIIFGILSVAFPISSILLFLTSLIYFVFILNKPECGLALSICAFAFTDSHFILIVSVFTFVALIYKYLRCKRHIDFNPMIAVMIVTSIYFVFRGYFTQSGSRSIIDTLSYLAFILTCIATVSLITSTSIMNRSIRLIVIISRLYTIIFLGYYVSLIVFSPFKVNAFIEHFYLTGISEAITNISFFAPFLALMIPLNFATMVASKNATGFIKSIIYVILMLLCTTVVSSFAYTLVMLVACIVILFVYNKKFLLLLLPAPFAAYLIVKFYEFLPDAYSVSAFTNNNTVSESSIELLKNNVVFGVGIGKQNLYSLISSAEAHVNSSVLDLILKIGIIGFILIMAVIVFMVVKNIVFIITCDPAQSYKVRIMSAGILASTLTFVTNCFYMDCLFDFRIVFLFSLIMSLGYVSGKCIESDYIDDTMVREYKQFN